MKAKILLGAVVTALTLTTFATDALLSPRAQGSQTKLTGSTASGPAIVVTYVGSTASASVSPRAQANQIKVVQDVANDWNPALACRKNMITSPRAVAACAQSVTMPGCMKIAAAK